MNIKMTIAGVIMVVLNACQLSLESPSYLRGFSTPASAEEVVTFSQRAAAKSEILSIENIGKSESGKPIIALKAATPSNEIKKLKVLIFAQQHGNEQSGKEAALMLISDFAKNNYTNWLDFLEIWIVPQVNPDGSDVNQRRNSKNLDLNRDHIVMNASETRALHQLFNRELHHVTIDIHEYQPYTESWANFGGYKSFDVQVGAPTNINVDETLRNFALNTALPAIENHLNNNGYSFHNYIVGPAPSQGRIRHSTVDFNDGRQSFAILNTLSFIFEGINGKDGYTENLEKRTFGQYEAIIALLNLLSEKASETQSMVANARKKLTNGSQGDNVAIRMEHYPGNNPLLLPLKSSKTESDTLVVVKNYHPLVKATFEIPKPAGYMVPKQDNKLVDLLKLHSVIMQEDFESNNFRIISMDITRIDNSTDEELSSLLPVIERKELKKEDISLSDYYFVSTAQLHSNFLVSLLEPQSMLGLGQRDGFEYLLKEKETYPIFRVE
jgi:hypothetical protein